MDHEGYVAAEQMLEVYSSWQCSYCGLKNSLLVSQFTKMLFLIVMVSVYKFECPVHDKILKSFVYIVSFSQ